MESEDDKVVKKPIIIRNSVDLQRLKLEKLMANPVSKNKPVIIPEKPKERGVPIVPDFVRNVMGSSAGAGSGEFHVYRHLRRKEYARQKYMKERAERDKLDEDYHQRLEENKRKAEERTSKNRLKRLKKKKKQKHIKKPKLTQEISIPESSSEQSEDDDNNTGEDSESSSQLNKIDNNDKKISDENRSEYITEENVTNETTNNILEKSNLNSTEVKI